MKKIFTAMNEVKRTKHLEKLQEVIRTRITVGRKANKNEHYKSMIRRAISYMGLDNQNTLSIFS